MNIKNTSRIARRIAKFGMLSLAFSQAGAETNYVTPEGDFGPIVGDATKPFHLVETAYKALNTDGGTLEIAPGTYREALTISTPTTLTKKPGATGEVRIGQRSEITTTESLNVLAYNCRLFDNDNFVLNAFKELTWIDDARSVGTGLFLSEYFNLNILDYAGLCEVWDSGGDDDHYDDIVANLYNPSVTHRYYDNQGNINQNSGLAVFSRHAMTEASDVEFTDSNGADSWANKGFMASTITKGGFRIRIYMSHTQSQNEPDDIEDRNAQILDIKQAVESWQTAHPNDLILVMGDLNVPAERADLQGLDSQYRYLREQFTPLGGKDVVRHTPNLSHQVNRNLRGEPSSDKATGLVHLEKELAYSYQPDAMTFSNGNVSNGNKVAKEFDQTSPNQRLDYIIYFPSHNKTRRLVPLNTHVVRVKTPLVSAYIAEKCPCLYSFSASELSDHYGIWAKFEMQLIPSP